MENQHRHIAGYRELQAAEIALMNRVKQLASEVGVLVADLKSATGLDQRWVATGATDLQKGFMALTRGIAQPTTF